jgi:Tripartite tricarboxylate transporter family receptor
VRGRHGRDLITFASSARVHPGAHRTSPRAPYADALASHSPSGVVVDNRPGGAGFIAVAALRQSAADGSTLLLGGAVLVTSFPHVYAKLPYDPQRDLVPVAVAAVTARAGCHRVARRVRSVVKIKSARGELRHAGRRRRITDRGGLLPHRTDRGGVRAACVWAGVDRKGLALLQLCGPDGLRFDFVHRVDSRCSVLHVHVEAQRQTEFGRQRHALCRFGGRLEIVVVRLVHLKTFHDGLVAQLCEGVLVFDELAATMRFLILAPDNHPKHLGQAREPMLAQFMALAHGGLPVDYQVRWQGTLQSAPIRHPELILMRVLEDCPAPESGDSGSAVVTWWPDGSIVLVGMLIASGDGPGLERVAYVNPAWQLFDLLNWSRLPSGTIELVPFL